MNTPTLEQTAKLPKWAQEYILHLDRRVVVAERQLNEYVDTQTPSPFYVDDLVCTGPGTPQFMRKFIQTNRVAVEHDGVVLEVSLRSDDTGINLRWGGPNHLIREIAMIPLSFCQVKLVAKDKMR